MDKGDECSSISSSSATITTNSNSNSNSNRDMYLKQINKSSHKISKPTIRNTPIGIPPPMAAMAMTMNLDPNPPPQSQQPPVYNINKNDFRDVVQKLTGSPAHERPPPPVTQPRPPSSRLQRIRPPPLAQISNRPPPPQIPPSDAGQGQSFPPLPPLPSVHPAAESPISAYMRFLQTSSPAPSPSPSPSPLWNGVAPNDQRMESPVSAYMRFLQSSVHSSSPRWNGVAPPPQQQPSSAFPLPFGCSIPSPRSSTYGMLSPSFLLSPTQLPPLSPTLPVPIPSPRWKGGI